MKQFMVGGGRGVDSVKDKMQANAVWKSTKENLKTSALRLDYEVFLAVKHA